MVATHLFLIHKHMHKRAKLIANTHQGVQFDLSKILLKEFESQIGSNNFLEYQDP